MFGSWPCAAEGESPATDAVGAPAPTLPRTEGPQDRRVEVPGEPVVTKAAGIKLPKEAELRERVQARWDAVIKGEIDKAYGFETPEYRKAHAEEDYRAAIGRRVTWHVATLKDLRYDRTDAAEAIIALDYSFALPGSDEMARTTSIISDRWVYSEDQWWRQDTQRPLGGKTQPQPSLQQ
jgi:hypothetical protein